MFYGAGAGSLPTATAVMADVVQAIKNMLLGVNEKQLTPADKRFSQYYLRLRVKDEVGAFASISELFNQSGISFERILQTPRQDDYAEIIVVTHRASNENFAKAMKQLDELDVVETV